MRIWPLLLSLLTVPAFAQNQSSSLDQVQRMYVAYYGRPADPVGLAHWRQRLDDSNGDLAAIIYSFGNSDEFRERFGALDTRNLIHNLYRQLFGRNADLTGLGLYSELLDSGQRSLLSLALDIANGAAADSRDGRILANKVLVAHRFTQTVLERQLQYRQTHIDAAKALLAGIDQEAASVAAAPAVIAELFKFDLPAVEVEPAAAILGVWQIDGARDLSDCDLADSSSDYELSVRRLDGDLWVVTPEGEFPASFRNDMLYWSGEFQQEDAVFHLDDASAFASDSSFTGKSRFRRVGENIDCQGSGTLDGELLAPFVNRPVSVFEVTLTQRQSNGFSGPFANGNVFLPFRVVSRGEFAFTLTSEQDGYLYLLDEYGALLARDDDSGSDFGSLIRRVLGPGAYMLSATTFLPGIIDALTLAATALDEGGLLAVDDIARGGFSLLNCDDASPLAPDNLLWADLDTCAVLPAALAVSYADGGALLQELTIEQEVEDAAEPPRLVGDARDCIGSDADLRVFSDDATSRYLENSCDHRVHVRWCIDAAEDRFADAECGEGSDYYQYHKTLDAGDKHYSFRELPSVGVIVIGACYGGRSSFEETDAAGAYDCD